MVLSKENGWGIAITDFLYTLEKQLSSLFYTLYQLSIEIITIPFMLGYQPKSSVKPTK
jgi:hypothetical protein